MQLKYKEHVFFLNTLSVKDEIKLINTTNEQDKNYVKPPTCSLSLSEIKNKENDLEFIDLNYEQSNENSFYLCLMLLSAQPFTSFVENIAESSSKIPPLITNFYKIITAIKNKKTISIENLIPFENCDNFVEGYRFILSVIHEQLLSHYYFKEDSWIVPSKQKTIKPIFPASSPITNMFHGKLVRDVGEVKSGYFDVLRAKIPTLLNIFKSKDLLNRPSVVLIETDHLFKEVPSGYMISAVLAGVDSYVLYIFSSKKWFKYTREGMTVQESIGEIPSIKYVLLSNK